MVDKLLLWAARVPWEVIREMSYADGTDVWKKYIWPAFLDDAENFGLAVYSELDARYPFEKIYQDMEPEYRRLRLSGITERQLDELRTRGWKIGYHLKRHFPLSRLPGEVRRKEMEPPDGMRGVVFSYPYGELKCVDARCRSLAESLGYPSAVANLVSPEAGHGRYFLPRMTVGPDIYDMHFELSGAKYFL